ncbi:MAG: hypothetical protein A4E55_00383 [Pelotomaculum sp. PtaU1.Bin035]|nr:MAG: hypothetical protein A4E55_00383 [Pelotomaculum sp. PtaU1.Bin035]
MNDKQNLTEYTLTQKEENLIEVMLDPANRMKSITDICKLANCSRVTYYEAFNKPGFVKIYKERSIALAEKYLGSVMNAFVREAARGSFQHGKVLLEMAGAYKEVTRKEVAGDKDNPVEVNMKVSRVAGLSPEEKVAIVAELRQADDDPADDLEQFRVEVTE